MKFGLKILAGCIAAYLAFATWFAIASNFNDGVVVGTYHLAQNGETSTLVLKGDHTFEQELAHDGIEQRAQGAWRSDSSFGGVVFSREFLTLEGEEPGGDGSTYADVRKVLGVYPVRLFLRTYHVEWYGRDDPASGDSIAGSYSGDEAGVQSSLVLHSDHTFDQVVTRSGNSTRAHGTWTLNEKGDIAFSKGFVKSTGATLSEGQTATAWNPKGSALQIEVNASSKLKDPVYWKWQMPW